MFKVQNFYLSYRRFCYYHCHYRYWHCHPYHCQYNCCYMKTAAAVWFTHKCWLTFWNHNAHTNNRKEELSTKRQANKKGSHLVFLGMIISNVISLCFIKSYFLFWTYRFNVCPSSIAESTVITPVIVLLFPPRLGDWFSMKYLAEMIRFYLWPDILDFIQIANNPSMHTDIKCGVQTLPQCWQCHTYKLIWKYHVWNICLMCCCSQIAIH